MPEESSARDLDEARAAVERLAESRGQTMSQNLETARRGIDAFNRRDVEALADLTTPDFAWFPALPGTVEKDGYRGREGVETYFGEIEGTWRSCACSSSSFAISGMGR